MTNEESMKIEETQAKFKWFMRKLFIGIIAAVIAGGVYLNSVASHGLVSMAKVITASQVPHMANLHVGDLAPQFQLSSTAGPFDLAQVQRPVLLELYAPWCIHCQKETKILNQIYLKYGYRVQVIAVSANGIAMDRQTPESQSDVITFAQKFDVQYPIAFDPNLTVANAYLMQGYPTIVIIDVHKKISSITAGEQTETQLEKRIKAVLYNSITKEG